MGYHYTTEEKWTTWRSPKSVAQYNAKGVINSGVCYAFSDLNNIKSTSESTFAYIPSSGGVNNTHASPRVYCYDFGFAEEVPESATIHQIEVKRLVSNWVYGGGIRDKLLSLRTSDNNTNDGWWGSYSTDTTVWGSRPNKSDFGTSKSAVGSDNKYQSWGPSDVRASNVRRSNFGCVYQCTGTSGTWSTPRIYYIIMRIKYSVTTSVWIQPAYNLSVSASPTEIKDDKVTSSNLKIRLDNTNNEAGNTGDISVSINNDNVVFSDGSSSKTITGEYISSGGSFLKDLEIIGNKVGSSNIKVVAAGKEKTVTINVSESYVPPTYSLSATLDSNKFKQNESTNLRISIKNTNNVEGNPGDIQISTPDDIVRFKLNNNKYYQKDLGVGTINANGRKSFTIPVITIGNGATNIYVRHDKAGNKTLPLTIEKPDPVLSITQSATSGQTVGAVFKLRYTIRNVGEVAANITKLKITLSDHLRFTDNTKSKTINLNKNLAVDKSITGEVDIKGNLVGTGTVTCSLEGLNASNKYNIKIFERYIENINFSLSTDECFVNDYVTLYANVTNDTTSEAWVDTFTINLPDGLQTLNGKSSIVIPKTKISPGSQSLLSENLIATTKGLKTISVSGQKLNVNVKEKVQEQPLFKTNWVYITKSVLYPTERSQIVLNYEVLNGVYPATVPETVCDLVKTTGGFKFSNNKPKIFINPKTLLEGESYNNLDSEQIYLDSTSPSNTARIKVSNDLLGEVFFDVESKLPPAEFRTSASINPSTVTHVREGAVVTLNVRTVNVGGPGNTGEMVVSLSGDCLRFEDNSNIKYFGGVNLDTNEEHSQSINIYTKGEGTGQISINRESNFSETLIVTVEPPLEPEYDISFNVEPPSIPLFTDDEQKFSKLRLYCRNTNSIEGSPKPLKFVLGDGLEFEDGSKQLSINVGNIVENGEYETVLDKRIKGVSVGAKEISLEAEELGLISIADLNITAPTPVAKGWCNINSCTFENNKGENGGAVANKGNLNYRSCKFKNNSGNNSCPNIYDKGVCRS